MWRALRLTVPRADVQWCSRRNGALAHHQRRRVTVERTSCRVGRSLFKLETGRIAALADGAILARQDDTVVLTTVVADRKAPDESGFLPLTVDYREKAHSAGKIPRTRDRRDANAGDKEILVGRAVDRVLRPLFHQRYCCPTQVLSTLQATDGAGDAVTMAINSASAALMMSTIPFAGPVAAVRVGRIDGRLVVNPDVRELAARGTMDLLYAGTETRTLMIEFSGSQVPEAEVIDALQLAHRELQPLLSAQADLAASAPPADLTSVRNPVRYKDYHKAARKAGYEKAFAAMTDASLSKAERGRAEGAATSAMIAAMREHAAATAGEGATPQWLALTADTLMRNAMSDAVISEKVRSDGRRVDEVRPITAEADVLPVVHGSALFTRGQTQALCTVTLGPSPTSEAQRYLGGTKLQEKRAQAAPDAGVYLHYEFPPYSVNEVGKVGGVNRRMVGHGNLAEKAIVPVMPPLSEFPYTTRITSEVTMSNGSSSMATACAASLALMDAGVPIRAPIAGVSIGMVSRGLKAANARIAGADGGAGAAPAAADAAAAAAVAVRDDWEKGQYALLTDILGSEDHYGDMDFKVAGTAQGITAIQLDVKLAGGVPLRILEEAVDRARIARLQILKTMHHCVAEPRPHLKHTAPLIEIVRFDPVRKRDIVGPGGATLREIEEQYDVNIDLSQDGVAKVFSEDPHQARQVKVILQELSAEIESGDVMTGTVTEIRDFGAMVEVLRGRLGVLHVSEVSHQSGSRPVTSLLTVGQKLQVKALEVDPLRGLIKLSRKALFGEDETDDLVAAADRRTDGQGDEGDELDGGADDAETRALRQAVLQKQAAAAAAAAAETQERDAAAHTREARVMQRVAALLQREDAASAAAVAESSSGSDAGSDSGSDAEAAAVAARGAEAAVAAALGRGRHHQRAHAHGAPRQRRGYADREAAEAAAAEAAAAAAAEQEAADAFAEPAPHDVDDLPAWSETELVADGTTAVTDDETAAEAAAGGGDAEGVYDGVLIRRSHPLIADDSSSDEDEERDGAFAEAGDENAGFEDTAAAGDDSGGGAAYASASEEEFSAPKAFFPAQHTAPRPAPPVDTATADAVILAYLRKTAAPRRQDARRGEHGQASTAAPQAAPASSARQSPKTAPKPASDEAKAAATAAATTPDDSTPAPSPTAAEAEVAAPAAATAHDNSMPAPSRAAAVVAAEDAAEARPAPSVFDALLAPKKAPANRRSAKAPATASAAAGDEEEQALTALSKADLIAKAKALGVAMYGSKVAIAQRILAAQKKDE